MNAGQLQALRADLKRYAAQTPYAITRQHADATLGLLDRHAKPWQRGVLEGHLTASAWVVDCTGRYAAMIHHRKLNRWLQPGGHIDDSDASWRAAAERELREETGLARFVSPADDAALFDVDVHAIPARADEPAHWHYDLRYLFVADIEAGANSGQSLALNAEESHACRWFALSEMVSDTAFGAETQRMIELTLRRAGSAAFVSGAHR
ncbi:MAG: NUDIX hydrolase [Burkholderiales bacterium]|nr:NUDIX hydrolase [Burkholderiales bacterium]